MKAIFWVGLIVLVLGIASFFVPLPHNQHHGVKVGDMSMGVDTSHSETVSPYISGVLILAGAGLIFGGRKTT